MMGRLNYEQQQLFYSFRLDEAVPDDHVVRQIAGGAWRSSVRPISWRAPVRSRLVRFAFSSKSIHLRQKKLCIEIVAGADSIDAAPT